LFGFLPSCVLHSSVSSTLNHNHNNVFVLELDLPLPQSSFTTTSLTICQHRRHPS
jgi:hypothetical protein